MASWLCGSLLEVFFVAYILFFLSYSCRIKIFVIVVYSYVHPMHSRLGLTSYKEHNSTICVYSGTYKVGLNAATRHRANYPQ